MRVDRSSIRIVIKMFHRVYASSCPFTGFLIANTQDSHALKNSWVQRSSMQGQRRRPIMMILLSLLDPMEMALDDTGVSDESEWKLGDALVGTSSRS